MQAVSTASRTAVVQSNRGEPTGKLNRNCKRNKHETKEARAIMRREFCVLDRQGRLANTSTGTWTRKQHCRPDYRTGTGTVIAFLQLPVTTTCATSLASCLPLAEHCHY